MRSLHPIRSSCQTLISQYLHYPRRILIFGDTGTGKSTLAIWLATQLLNKGALVRLLDADPGSPAFGIPGCLSLHSLDHQKSKLESQLQDVEPLCSLDAGRFRLPLITGINQLIKRESQRPEAYLLIDTPGVTRGVGAAELLPAMIQATRADLVVVLVQADVPAPLSEELERCSAEVLFLDSDPDAQKPVKSDIKQHRTQRWLDYMQHAHERRFRLDRLQLTGMLPASNDNNGWTGRQVALINGQRTLGMGQIAALDDDEILITTPVPAETKVHRLLIRDAVYNDKHGLHTAIPSLSDEENKTQPTIAPLANEAFVARQAMDQLSPPIMMRVGLVDATLVNGVFGDPLLLLQIGHQKRCLLFDLGYHGPLSARTAHQVTDVFISHAHVDHICGFLWLMRCRIGHYPSCRIFGPPGLAKNIAGMIDGILWDRIGDKAPHFDIYEVHGNQLHHWQIAAGSPLSKALDVRTIKDQIIWQEAQFQIRAVTLDHTAKDCGPGNPFTPVLAYAFEPLRQVNVRQERLRALNLSAGPWLQVLKDHVLNGVRDAEIQVNDRTFLSGELADQILLKSAGKRLVYATDLADSTKNRSVLCSLAQDAHTLFCEASFMNGDRDLAGFTGHLTTKACGEIGTEAAVQHLIPFHFSGRYQALSDEIYDEVSASCPNTRKPAS